MPPPPDDTASYGGRTTFYDVLTAAIADIVENGYDSAERVQYWTDRIREAAIRSMTPPHILEHTLNETMRAIYRAKIERGGILKMHPGVSRFTLERIAPRLRGELDRRIMASAGLIKLNRQAAVEKTLQRFSGWATSIPPGGSDAVDRREVKTDVRKSLSALPFEERRVLVDQGHKFTANLSEILAVDGGAIAAIWHSHWRQANYNYRQDHKHRDEHVYVMRGNWALSAGLMKPDGHEYTDEITKPGEEVYCRCFYQWIHSLKRLPDGMLTEKGRGELMRARAA